MDEVVKMYGFVNKWTIWFFELAETLTDSQLLNAYIVFKSGILPLNEEE